MAETIAIVAAIATILGTLWIVLLGQKTIPELFARFKARIRKDGWQQYNKGKELYQQAKVETPHSELIEEAITCYQAAIDSGLRTAEVYLYLGIAYDDVGKPLNAIEVYSQVVSLDPNNAEAHRGLGLDYLYLELFDKAIPHLQKWADLCPDDPNALFFLGRAYHEKGKR